MSTMVVTAFAIAALLWSPIACASSITNRDDKDFKVTVVEGEAKQDHVLKPSAVLEGVCKKGCVIRLNDSANDEYELDGSEILSIEDGYLYYDGPPATAVPKAGNADQPSRPGTK